MSLINEALKKAQREGNGKDAPAARSPDVTSATQGGRKPGAAAIAGGVVALLAIAGGVGYYLTRDEPKREVASVPPVPKVEPKPSVETPATPSVASPEVKPAAETPLVVEPAKPVETVTKVETPSALKPTEVPVPSVVPAPPVTPPAPAQNPEITSMLDRMKVSLGRKKTGRCVIDSVVFKVGDQISASPVINIKTVTDTEVVFSDVNGVEYAKKYK